MSWPSCHLWAVRPRNTNAHLTRVNVSIETDEVCEGFGEYSAVANVQAWLSTPLQPWEEKQFTPRDLSASASAGSLEGPVLLMFPQVFGMLWILDSIDFFICSPLLHLSLLQQLLVPSSNRESGRICGLYYQDHLHLQETDFFFVWS